MSFFQLTSFIFLNNIKSAFFGMIFGVFFGIFPVIVTLVNGYFLGYVSSIAVKEGGAISLLSLLPHGIFELTAIFISLGLGLKLGINPLSYSIKYFFPKISNFKFIICLLLAILFAPLTLIGGGILLIFNLKFRKNFFKQFESFFINSIKVFVFLIIPLLMIAAIIESCLIFAF
jgi:uncharacterized membrane protein SpoIIM required for sporulation